MIEVRKLYDKMLAIVPVKREKDDEFRSVLRHALGQYMIVVKELEKGNVITEDNVKEVGKIIDKLNDIVATEYKGLSATAYTKMSNLMMGDKKKSALGSSIKIIELDVKGLSFYRMRKMDERRNIDYKDLFHIPLDMKGIIPTHRFSSPGYPCLYIGTSINACWEEMDRPLMSQSMVSRFEAQENLVLIDLRIPSFEEWSKEIISYVRAFPLLIACSVMVKESEALFKPEYIIPHLLMEFVIGFNAKPVNKYIHGIYYTSVYLNNDYGYGSDKFENLAIPVFKPLTSKKYCSEMCRLFKLTNPTCDELEQIKTGGYGYSPKYNEKAESITPNKEEFYEDLFGNYEESTFGKIEKRLQNTNVFPLFSMV